MYFAVRKQAHQKQLKPLGLGHLNHPPYPVQTGQRKWPHSNLNVNTYKLYSDGTLAQLH